MLVYVLGHLPASAFLNQLIGVHLFQHLLFDHLIHQNGQFHVHIHRQMAVRYRARNR